MEREVTSRTRASREPRLLMPLQECYMLRKEEILEFVREEGLVREVVGGMDGERAKVSVLGEELANVTIADEEALFEGGAEG